MLFTISAFDVRIVDQTEQTEQYEIMRYLFQLLKAWSLQDAELGQEGYAMSRKDRMGRRGGGVLLYIKDTIPAYEVQLQEEADCNEAMWCKLGTGHTTVSIGVVYRCPNITKQNNEKDT